MCFPSLSMCPSTEQNCPSPTFLSLIFYNTHIHRMGNVCAALQHISKMEEILGSICVVKYCSLWPYGTFFSFIGGEHLMGLAASVL